MPSKGPDVHEDPRSEPWRDRDPGHARRVRARREDRRGVPLRGPQLAAPAEGRRGVPDRRAGASGARLPRRRRDHPRREGVAAPTRSTRATASSPRTPTSPRPPPRRASRSSARPPRCSRWPATRSRRRSTRSPPAFPCSSRPRHRNDIDELLAGADEIGFPIFAKAVAGGGGRGMRRVDEQGRPARGARGGHARGRQRVRRPDDVPRAGRRAARATSRCRSSPTRPGEHHAPVRAGLLGAAPPPEGRRDRARRRTSTRTSARRCTATRSRSRSRSAT